MEQELGSLGKEFRLIEESHGRTVLNLVLVVGYLRKLLDNARVSRHLRQRHAEFVKLVETRGLVDGPQAKAPGAEQA